MKEIKIDICTAKEAMVRVVEYMKLESIQVIETVSLESLKHYQSNSTEKKIEWEFENFDLIIPENKAVLEAIGIKDHTLIKEAETQLFLKMFMRYLHKNRIKVFLLTENEENLDYMRQYLKEHAPGIKIVETATMETHGVSDDMILNRINGVEIDCILASLPAPLQKEFIVKNRMLIDAKLWVGLGNRIVKEAKTKKTKLRTGWFSDLMRVLSEKITKL